MNSLELKLMVIVSDFERINQMSNNYGKKVKNRFIYQEERCQFSNRQNYYRRIQLFDSEKNVYFGFPKDLLIKDNVFTQLDLREGSIKYYRSFTKEFISDPINILSQLQLRPYLEQLSEFSDIG